MTQNSKDEFARMRDSREIAADHVNTAVIIAPNYPKAQPKVMAITAVASAVIYLGDVIWACFKPQLVQQEEDE